MQPTARNDAYQNHDAVRELTAAGVLDAGGNPQKHDLMSEQVSANKTLDIGDVGVVQRVDTDAKTITLPATVVGYVYVIENDGAADGDVLVTISPNSADKIMGAGLTAADDKDLLNTKATAKRGDRVVLIGDGADGWYVAEIVGTWARQA